MSDNTGAADDLDTIQQRKHERLQTGTDPSGTAAGATGETDSRSPSSEDRATPSEPVSIDGTRSFATLLDRHDVVLADFSAAWCGPCRVLEPIVERVASRTRAAVATIDIDANPGVAEQYGVRSVPTLFVFAEGELVERLVGVQDEAVLTDLIQQYT